MCEYAMKLEDLSGEVISRLMGPNSVTSLGWKERNSDGYFGTSTTMATTDASHSRQTPIILLLVLSDAYRLPLSCTSAIPTFWKEKGAKYRRKDRKAHEGGRKGQRGC